MEGIDAQPDRRRDHRQRGAAGAFNLRSLCRATSHREPLVVGEPDVDLGIEIMVERPREVGADRLVNAVGAHMTLPAAPLIVIDFGTATTFDVVDADGAYRGGVIAPGHQPLARGAAPGRRQAAAHRHPAARRT